MSVARSALPSSLGPLLLVLACSAHPPAPAGEMQASQALSAGTSAPPRPVSEASSASSPAPPPRAPCSPRALRPPLLRPPLLRPRLRPRVLAVSSR